MTYVNSTYDRTHLCYRHYIVLRRALRRVVAGVDLTLDKISQSAYYLARILFETKCRLGIKEVVLMGSSHMRMGITVKVAR